MTAGSERGLTLVEMLVVLAIVGIMAGAVTLSLRTGGSGAETEAVRLASRLRLAADDVRLAERPLAFAWDAQGYGFVDWDAGRRRWVPDRLNALRRHDLPRGLRLTVRGGPGPAPIAADGLGPPIAARIARGDEAWDVAFDGLDAHTTGVAAR